MPLSDAFITQGRAMSRRLGLKWSDLLTVMNSESELKPWARNPAGANGLSQIMDDILPGLGWTTGPDAYRQLSAEGQLPYIERYFKRLVDKGINSVGRMYQANFVPATLSDPITGPGQVLLRKGGDRWGGKEAGYYAANTVFDHGSKGFITVGDLETSARINAQKNPLFIETMTRYRQLFPEDFVTFWGKLAKAWLGLGLASAAAAGVWYWKTGGLGRKG